MELDIINIINKHIPSLKNKKRPIRDGLTVGASFLLAAVGRACHPTSKLGWYDWCKETSLEYSLKSSFKRLDSQHFWDQMNALPQKAIPLIEEEIVKKLINNYKVKLGCLFFDTTNFFTFIDSLNDRCELAQRGRNKQKRFDLRQVGVALLVSKKAQFPLFHRTYHGNKNDYTVFKEVFKSLLARLKNISHELSDITLVFDKGNNSKDNFKKIDKEKKLYYVGGLVPSYFKDLIKKANKNFSSITIQGEKISVFRIKKEIWGKERTCVVTISSQLKEGQIRGIYQHLQKKYKELERFKQQLENPKKIKVFQKNEIEQRLKKIIRGQFIEDILKYDFVKINKQQISFTYVVDSNALKALENEVLGRKILVTNRHNWSNKEIIQAYSGQAKVEYAFRNLKNPFHMAVRPQYHWTDQKIETHILICIIGYLLTTVAYTKAKEKAGYKRNISNFLEDLRSIRLASLIEKKNGRKGLLKVEHRLENIRNNLKKTAQVLEITDQNIRPKLTLGVYTQ